MLLQAFVHHFVAIGGFKLELQSGKLQFGPNRRFFSAVWPWNVTDDIEKQQVTSHKDNQAFCIISSQYVTLNLSDGPETAK